MPADTAAQLSRHALKLLIKTSGGAAASLGILSHVTGISTAFIPFLLFSKSS